MPGRWQQIGNDVFYTTQSLSLLTAEDIGITRDLAMASPRRRARLCTHAAAGDALHEMLIAVERSSYIRPHRHLNRPESLLVLDGQADAVFFAEDGAIEQVIRLAPFAAGGTFYYRVERPQYHTLLLRTPWLIFVETCTGPFDPSRSEFAPWAPEEQDAASVEIFRQEIECRVSREAHSQADG